MNSTALCLLCLLSCVLVGSCIESIIQEVTDAQRSGDLITKRGLRLTDKDLRTNRDRSPSSYLLDIKSFSTMVDSQKERYESGLFEAGGYKWRLVLYPNGNKKDGGTGYISLYLAVDGSSFMSHRREVYVDVKFLVYNKHEDTYLAVQDGEIKRFHVVKTEWGFPQFLPFVTFNNTRNGYLVDDSCVFGVEVFVIEPAEKWEQFSVTNPSSDDAKFTWKIKNFSILDEEYYYSGKFAIADTDWALKVYPKGSGTGKDNSLSMYLIAYGNETLDPSSRPIYANYKLRVLDQQGNKHVEREYTYWFPYRGSWGSGWGTPEFLRLTDLRNISKGYLVNNILVVETEISKISVTKYFP